MAVASLEVRRLYRAGVGIWPKPAAPAGGPQGRLPVRSRRSRLWPARAARDKEEDHRHGRADAHPLADRLERNQRPQSDQAMAAKLIRALLAGRAAGDIIGLQDE